MSTRSPRVSIGLPVYNGEAYVAQAVDTLLAQSFADFELIIFDNASTDATESICRERAARDPRVRYERRPTNVGATRNFNGVVEMARGEYFKWAAHDDMHEPDYLARCVEALDRDSTVVLAHTRLRDIDDDGNSRDADDPKLDWDSASAFIRFRELTRPDHRCESIFGLIRSDVLRRTRLLQDFAGCDRVLLAELALAGRFYEAPEVLFVHREHKKRSTHEYRSEQTRTAWFNPSKAGRPAFPHGRMILGYLGAIRRAHVPLSDKLRCLTIFPSWIKRNRDGLWQDTAFAIAYVVRPAKRRVLPSRETTPAAPGTGARQADRSIR